MHSTATPHTKRPGLWFCKPATRERHNFRFPRSATVDTVCIEASQWIYTVDTNGVFSRFDPTTLTYNIISWLSCPTNYSPNSMAVDQNAVAWVAYGDGNLFEVNTSTGHRQVISFKPD